MTSKHRIEPSTHQSLVVGVSLIVVGVVLSALVSTLLDGFVRGMALGAGVALVVIGAYLLSPVIRRALGRDRRGGEGAGRTDEGWLPSRDGDR